MLLRILLGALSVAFGAWAYMKYRRVWRPLSKFPGPIAWPLVGNGLQIGFTPEDYLTNMLGWFRLYNNECMRAYLGPQPYLFLPNSKAVELLLTSNTLTYKEDLYTFLKPWLGTGLLTANYGKWQKHRKMITPSFHFQILLDFLHVMNEATGRFKRLLDTFAGSEEIFDFQDVITRSTIDIICESAMGMRVNAIEGDKSAIVQAMNDICYVIQDRVFSWVKRYDWIFYLSPQYRVQERALKTMRVEFSKIIEARRRTLETLQQQADVPHDDDIKRPKMAFLDNLLTARIDGEPLSFQDIFEEVSTFMFEGHDTTASGITFAVYCLARHPEVQQRAYEEQVALFGTEEHQPTYQEVQDMKYLEQVIKESLRLFPSVPMIARSLTSDTEIDGRLVPNGTTLGVPIISLGRDERNFEQADKFKPERYAADNRVHANPFDTVPFSAGPRNCVGQKFAMMEMKVTIANILRHFHILPALDGTAPGLPNLIAPHSEKYDPRLAVLVTLKSVNGVHIRLKKRQ